MRILYFIVGIAGIFLLFGCQQPEVREIIVTEVITIADQPVVVTRIVRQTVEAPVTVPALLKPTTEPNDIVTLDISHQTQLGRLDPQIATDAETIDLVENLFVGLTRFNHFQNRVDPALAINWDVSNDGLTWTFHLRDDVFWMRVDEGGDVTAMRQVVAEDVVTAFRRACDPRVEVPASFILFIIEGCEAVNRTPQITDADLGVIGVSAINPQLVQVRLLQPANHFLTMTTLWWLRPVPTAALLEFEDDWDIPENILSSGAFLLTAGSAEGVLTTLTKNPAWPEEENAGNVDVINIHHLESTEAFALWQELELDFSPLPRGFESVALLETTAPRYRLAPNQRVFYLAYNFDSEVFKYPEVRRAFGAAINRDVLINEVYGGEGYPLRHFAPSGIVGAPPLNEIGKEFDPDYAEEQMFLSPISSCRLISPIRYQVNSSDLALQHAEALRRMWAENLNCPEELIEIEQVQFGTLLANTRRDAGNNRPDIWDLGWVSSYPDEQNWVGTVLHCQNGENRQNRPCSEVDELINRAAATLPHDERWAIYRSIEDQLFGANGLAPITPIYMEADYLMVQRWLVDYQPAAFGGEQYDRINIDVAVRDLERAE